MGACTEKFEFETVRGCHHRAAANADITIGKVGPEVHAEHHVDFGIFQDAILDHQRGSSQRRSFLGWLKHQLDRAAPGVAILL